MAERRQSLRREWYNDDDFKAIGATVTTVYTTLEFLLDELCPNEEISSSSGECCCVSCVVSPCEF